MIAQYFPDDLARVIQMMESSAVPLMKRNTKCSAASRTEIGCLGAELRRLPVVFVESIAGSHRPSEVPGNPIMPHATHLADTLVNMMGIGALNDQPQALPPNPESLEKLPIDEGIMTRIQERLDKQRGLLGAVAMGALS